MPGKCPLRDCHASVPTFPGLHPEEMYHSTSTRGTIAPRNRSWRTAVQGGAELMAPGMELTLNHVLWHRWT